MKKVLLSALALAAVSPAQAAFVTFDGVATPGMSAFGNGASYSENGLDFTSSRADSDSLLQWGTNNSFNAQPGGATMFQNWIGEFLIVSKTGGGSFKLNSFDLADAFNSGSPSVIPFSYTDASGVHNLSLTLDSTVGLQTFVQNLSGVTSFSLQQVSPYFQIDNIVYNAAGGVPEPAAWAMMLAGFGLVGSAMRRRSKVAVTFA